MHMCSSQASQHEVTCTIPAAHSGKSKRRHHGQTKMAVSLTAATLVMVALIGGVSNLMPPKASERAAAIHASSEFSSSWMRNLEDANNNDNDDGEWSDYACDGIFTATDPNTADRCAYAQTCNGGEGLFASFVFCNNSILSTTAWCAVLSPFLLVWLVTLFRMLGSTAEDFFSPSLEMFSFKMGLPPRFAGVSLLALGNGSADVSATVNAITKDPANGYQLSLGALTGASMFITCMVMGSILITAGGIPCRGALVRDVVMMAVAVVVVFLVLRSGSIDTKDTTTFFGMYLGFVVVVLIADIYHRKVVVPRLRATEEARERERQLVEGRRAMDAAADAVDRVANEALPVSVAPPPGISESNEEPNTEMRLEPSDDASVAMMGGAAESTIRIMPTGVSEASSVEEMPIHNRALNAVLNALSNYDKYEETGTEDPRHAAEGWGAGVDGVSSETERPIKLHGKDGLLNRHASHSAVGTAAETHLHVQMPTSAGGDGEHHMDSPYTIMEGGMDEICADGTGGFGAHSWTGAWHDGREELRVHWHEMWEDMFDNEDNSSLDKFLLAAELPFTVMRKSTVSIPCEGYYCRALVALSLVLSPIWLGIYFYAFFDKFLLWECLVLCGLMIIAALFIMRYAPGGDGNMNLLIAGPIALYGFVVAATWIDAIADRLVGLLNFLGVVCHIPGPIMGLTILAWGNSMADLAANVTMAKKGLANMAATACWAGPTFNILIGLAAGFTAMGNITGKDESEVALSASITTGFIFTLINCAALVFSGVFLFKGFIPPEFGYFSIALYVAYVITCLYVQFA